MSVLKAQSLEFRKESRKKQTREEKGNCGEIEAEAALEKSFVEVAKTVEFVLAVADEGTGTAWQWF